MAANCFLAPEVEHKLNEAILSETHESAAERLKMLARNADLARSQKLPLCQDTGMAVVFCELGQDVHITGGLLEDAVNEGVRQGYARGWLRKSVVGDPLRRINTGDNTPAVLHARIVPGRHIRLTIVPKGFGSENMCRIKMLAPSEGAEGVKAFIKETVCLAGSNACPPFFIGVGIGGTFEKAALMSKEALLGSLEDEHPDPYYASLEKEWLAMVNETGIGVQGFGGSVTALALRIQAFATHIAGLPVAVNVSCHVTRHACTVI
jgi:fumarate hydratase subunit alpha